MGAEHPDGHLVVHQDDDEGQSEAVADTEEEKQVEKAAGFDLGGQVGLGFDVKDSEDGYAAIRQYQLQMALLIPDNSLLHF